MLHASSAGLISVFSAAWMLQINIAWIFHQNQLVLTMIR